MKKLFLLLLFCQVSSSVKHSLKYFTTGSSGVTNLPEFVGTVMMDEILIGYCDTNTKIEPRQDWMKKILEDDPQQLEWYTIQCSEIQPDFFKSTINTLKQDFNQSGDLASILNMDKAEIRTNWEDPSHMIVLITAPVVVLAVVLIAVTGFIIYKKKKASRPPSSSDNSFELSETDSSDMTEEAGPKFNESSRPPSSPDNSFELSEADSSDMTEEAEPKFPEC